MQFSPLLTASQNEDEERKEQSVLVTHPLYNQTQRVSSLSHAYPATEIDFGFLFCVSDPSLSSFVFNMLHVTRK